MTIPSRIRRRLPRLPGPALLIVAMVLVVAACVPGAAQSLAPGQTPAPTPLPSAAHPLTPAPLEANPFGLLAWAFTPIFQAFFITLVLLDQLTGNIAIAIILLTILIKVLLIPIFRRQIVSTRRMQLIAPEVKELQRRFRGDRVKIQQATAALYKERGVSPAGCLPAFLQMLLLIPLYSVFSQGLTNFNPQAMMEVFGFTILDLHCAAAPIVNEAGHVLNPCLNPTAFGVNWGVPEVFIGTAGSLFSGLSILALISSLVQLVASRMTLPPASSAGADDPTARTQRQMAIFLPFISLIYGSILPAGLFLYWIFSTVFSIVQQYLILGWGGMFPLFGWTPGFAVDHQPRFPVAEASASAPSSSTRAPGAATRSTPQRTNLDRSTSAAATIRQRGRQGRRGRRR